MPIPKNSDLLEHARKLRQDMTPQERKLWYLFLQKYPVKIYKQRIIGSYIADFYCASAKLVIEVDGSQHYFEKEQQKDTNRSAYFESLGLHVIRYSNADINERFDRVCESIHQHIQSKLG
ncbi:MAG: endonuclease domain-containing protein [Oscillospiraceae bacterium]|nr:endonuclease domain-containing protein [Oscillospiraceae bacterium]